MTQVEISGSRILIDGEPRVLLCASLFPFRVPMEQWRERLLAVAEMGYHCVDVYVPWNFHETAPGVWDFTGRRDVEHFLELAHEVGLYVLARPGPYICSEWDGGALPAWLGTEPGLRVRQHEPRYLAAVEAWFAKIMPLLAKHQVTRGGPVLMVQLENELDFFDCDEPGAYMAALRDAAWGHGIDVPLLGCAGQGDLQRATGDVDGVVPGVNLYPSDGSADIEEQVRYYETALRARGFPLLVTETNRLHRTLKRLIAGGVRLAGPYLQGSGWNFGFTTAVNNWGNPLAFMTHDYDFGGAIAPDGVSRPDAAEGRELAALISALGPRLASATPLPAVKGVAGAPVAMTALALEGGGELLGLTNLESTAADVTIHHDGQAIPVALPPSTCTLLVRDLPLDPLGVAGAIVLASAELCDVGESSGDTAEIGFASDQAATVVLRFDEIPSIDVADGLDAEVSGDLVTVTGGPGLARLVCGAMSLTIAVRPRHCEPAIADRTRPPRELTQLQATAAAPTGGLPWRDVGSFDDPPMLERAGIFAGSAVYRCDVDLDGVESLVLSGASDIIEPRIDGAPAAWIANPGTDLVVAVPPARRADTRRLDLRVQVWGHSNFDDGRLPSLRLGSLRGIGGVLAVTRRVPLSEGWILGADEATTASVGDAPAPRGGWGGWMTAEFPNTVTYERTLDPQHNETHAALRLVDGQGRHDIALDGEPVGTITPSCPVLWLGAVCDGQRLTVSSTRTWGEAAGTPELLAGRPVRGWRLSAAGQGEFVQAAARSSDDAERTDLPLTVPAGCGRWLRLDLSDELERRPDGDVVVRFQGRGLLLTAIAADELLARVWTEPPVPAALAGGQGNLVLVPRPFLERDAVVSVLAESTGASEGRVDSITFQDHVDTPTAAADAG